MANIIHYRNKCIGCGVCQEQQPGLWRMSRKDGKATLIHSTAKKEIFVLPVSDQLKQQVKEMEKICPSGSIKVF